MSEMSLGEEQQVKSVLASMCRQYTKRHELTDEQTSALTLLTGLEKLAEHCGERKVLEVLATCLSHQIAVLHHEGVDIGEGLAISLDRLSESGVQVLRLSDLVGDSTQPIESQEGTI